MSLFEVHIGNSVTFKRPDSLSVWVGIKPARPEELRGILKNPRGYWAELKVSVSTLFKNKSFQIHVFGYF